MGVDALEIADQLALRLFHVRIEILLLEVLLEFVKELLLFSKFIFLKSLSQGVEPGLMINLIVVLVGPKDVIQSKCIQ